MSLVRPAQLCAVIAVMAGCRAPLPQPAAAPPGALAPDATAAASSPSAGAPAKPQLAPAAVAPVAFLEPLPRPAEPDGSQDLVDDNGQLSLARLIAAVESQNPSLQAMLAAWRAAAERYPQVVALDDPMFMTMLAPASFDSADVESAYVLEGSQKIPWCGKRAARGQMALAEANAAGQDARQTRVLLSQMVQVAYWDYFLVRRELELNRENVQIMRQVRSTAQAKYRANQVTQRDVLQAEVELSQIDRRSIELTRMETIAVARINTLLRRPVQAALPPAATEHNLPEPIADVELLQSLARAQRPDLALASARVRAERAALDLASKSYYPDVEVFGRYDSFWQPRDTQSDLRGQLGVRMNVPVYGSKNAAAVREASYRLSQRQAEYQQKSIDVQFDVQNAYSQFVETQQALALYSQKLLPAIEQSSRAAKSDYDVGKGSFLEVALAQRQYSEMREKFAELVAEGHRRLANLEWSIGGSAVPLQMPEAIPAAPE